MSIVESPGGAYHTNHLKKVYAITGMEAVANETGAELNYDLRVEKIENPEAKIVKSLKILKPLADADLIINIAKLKTHGIMVYTGAVKNMFGSIPGIEKADFHLRLNDYDRFADSLIDIYLAAKPQLNIIDGITAMEGDGPSAGIPKYLGAILASQDAFACDYAALQLIGLDYKSVPVLKMAEERGLFQSDQVEFVGADLETIKPDEFDVPALKHIRPLERYKILGFLKSKVRPRPEILQTKCVACGKCMEVCPPKAITRGEDKKLSINYNKCISCLCCHEFCPEKAVKIRKNIIRKIFEYRRVDKSKGTS